MAKWECDGCNKVIEHDDPEHLCGCRDHMGWMLVGSPCWTDYHDKGIHPMTQITKDVQQILNNYLKVN